MQIAFNLKKCGVIHIENYNRNFSNGIEGHWIDTLEGDKRLGREGEI